MIWWVCLWLGGGLDVDLIAECSRCLAQFDLVVFLVGRWLLGGGLGVDFVVGWLCFVSFLVIRVV